MRILHLGAVVAVLALATGCKKKLVVATTTDAGPMQTSTPSAAPPAIHDAGPIDAGAGVPRASDELELVAIGKSASSKIIWLQAHGNRVWLSGRNLDAFADGDGPLGKGPDPLAKLDYKPGVHRLQVVGAWPHLFLLRSRITEGPWQPSERVAFVYDAAAGTWAKAKPLACQDSPFSPWAFVAFRDGALVVNSQNAPNSEPMYFGPELGTTLELIGADGAVTRPDLGIPKRFMAWSASADDGVLSFLGATGAEKGGPVTTDVLRISAGGVKTAHVPQTWSTVIAYWSRVVEHAGTTLLVPPEAPELEAWKPSYTTLYAFDGDTLAPRAMGGGETCVALGAQPVGDAIYALRKCNVQGVPVRLVRRGPDGKTTEIKLGPVAGHREACAPTSLAVRGADDLWVAAECGAVPAVFRLGRPQEPVVLP